LENVGLSELQGYLVSELLLISFEHLLEDDQHIGCGNLVVDLASIKPINHSVSLVKEVFDYVARLLFAQGLQIAERVLLHLFILAFLSCWLSFGLLNRWLLPSSRH